MDDRWLCYSVFASELEIMAPMAGLAGLVAGLGAALAVSGLVVHGCLCVALGAWTYWGVLRIRRRIISEHREPDLPAPPLPSHP